MTPRCQLACRTPIPLRRAAWFAVALVAAGLHASAAITPVAYYRMGEDDSAAAPGEKTFSIRNHLGTGSFSVSSTDGSYTGDVAAEAVERVGSSLAFSFSGSGYIPASRLTATDNFGIEAWVKPAAAAGDAIILYNGASGTNGCGIAQSGNLFQGRIGTTSFGSGPLVAGTWAHVALVRSSGIATLYVDGVDCGSSNVELVTPSGSLCAGGVSGGPNFSGALDEVRTFTFRAGEFTPDDLIRQASEIAVEQPAGVPVASGGACDFGVTNPGSAVVRSFVITSSGMTDLSGVYARVTGADASSFALVTSPATSLATGTSASIAVQFSPTRPGRRNALLTVTSNDPDESPYSIAITGTTPGQELAVEQPAGTGLTTGTVSAWGTSSSIVAAPSGLSGVTSLAFGMTHALALRADSTVVAWGGNAYGQATVPSGLSSVSAIAAGGTHSLALTAGGVVGWGRNNRGQIDVPAGLMDVIAVAAGSEHSLALRSDGTVVAWGYNLNGQASVPSGLADVTAIAAGDRHSLALKSDGTVVAWGFDSFGQATVPAGLSGVVAIAAGSLHSLALKSDGTVVAWGSSSLGQATVPSGLSGVTKIAAGQNESIALKDDGSLVTWGFSLFSIPSIARGRSVAITSGAAAVISDSSVSFGDQMVPYSTVPKVYTLRNLGTTPLRLTSITTSGQHAADFGTVFPELPLDLAPAASVEIATTFTPSALGTRQATLRIGSDDPGKGDFFVALAGKGNANPATPREAWRLRYFGSPANAGNAADAADPNRNGISNLMEYALGGDPLSSGPGSSILPRCGISEAGTLEFKFTRDSARTDIILTIQASDDLTSPWIDLARSSLGGAFLPLVEGVTLVESETGAGSIREVTLEDAITVSDPSKRRRFLRLVAAEP